MRLHRSPLLLRAAPAGIFSGNWPGKVLCAVPTGIILTGLHPAHRGSPSNRLSVLRSHLLRCPRPPSQGLRRRVGRRARSRLESISGRQGGAAAATFKLS